MKSVFWMAAAVLGISGVLHLANVVMSPVAGRAVLPVILVGLFGLAFLVLAYLLYRRHDSAVVWGFFLPLIGLALSLVNLTPNPDPYSLAFIVLDILAILLCGYLLLTRRGVIRRVR